MNLESWLLAAILFFQFGTFFLMWRVSVHGRKMNRGRAIIVNGKEQERD